MGLKLILRLHKFTIVAALRLVCLLNIKVGTVDVLFSTPEILFKKTYIISVIITLYK